MRHTSSPSRRPSRRAFTIIDLAACMAVATVGVASFLAMSQPGGGAAGPNDNALAKARAAARQIKDAHQVRGIVQAMIIFANNNQDQYPLPSIIDAQNATVALADGKDARSKDLTNHIFSMLIFQGVISPELCISPAETNKKIRIDEDYEFDSPKTAPKPADALWDPAFAADFTVEKRAGNVSYAHLQPSDNRLSMWQNTFSATEALLGNRGPEIAKVDRNAEGWVKKVKPAGQQSNTFRIHGEDDAWEGNIGFNDGHVQYVSSLRPPRDDQGKPLTYKLDEKGEKTAEDVFFYDEADAYEGTNLFLGIFTKAGKKPEDFHAVWD